MSHRAPVIAAAVVTGCIAPLPSSLAFFTSPPPPVIEYVNDLTDHYVLLYDAQEIAAVDGGSAGPGWHRTGYVFAAGAPLPDGSSGNICRFYAPGPNSHFF